MKYIVKNCPAKFYSEIDDKQKCWQKWEEKSEYCQDCSDCVMKQIVGLCKDVKEKDPIVAGRDKQTGEIISIGGCKELRKYKQALEDIKEIVKKERADVKTVYVRKTYERLNKIQNKIDEVLKQ